MVFSFLFSSFSVPRCLLKRKPLCYLTSRISSVILWILNYQFLFKLAALLATSYNSLLSSRSGLGSRLHLITVQPATSRSSLNPTTCHQLQNCQYSTPPIWIDKFMHRFTLGPSMSLCLKFKARCWLCLQLHRMRVCDCNSSLDQTKLGYRSFAQQARYLKWLRSFAGFQLKFSVEGCNLICS